MCHFSHFPAIFNSAARSGPRSKRCRIYFERQARLQHSAACSEAELGAALRYLRFASPLPPLLLLL